jgi:hypothetical protein
MSLVKPFVSVPFEARRQEISVNGFKFETFGKNGFIEAPVSNRVCIKECVIEENEVDTDSRLQKVSVKVVFIAFLCIIKHQHIVILLGAGLKKTELCSIFFPASEQSDWRCRSSSHQLWHKFVPRMRSLRHYVLHYKIGHRRSQETCCI